MRRWILFVAAAMAAFSVTTSAAEPERQYFTYSPPRATESADKIEVLEFFWYGCGHCYKLDPFVQTWVKKQSKDVVFRRVAAVFPGRDGTPGAWAPGAKLYYTLESLGLLDKLHDEAFAAVHKDRINLNNEKVMLDWLGKKGVDTVKFAEVYRSFAIATKISRAMQQSQSYGLDGVPALIVDGRYRAMGDDQDALVTVDQLIAKIRREQPGKK
jgi:protein dithiol oxidoreductase (disulfide-forming)